MLILYTLNQEVMRVTVLLLFLAFLSQSCHVYYVYPDEGANALTELSFPAHDREVELFFVGESAPERDYIRLSVIKESNLTRSTAPGRLLQSMQRKAQQLGADAVVIMGAQDTEAVTNWIDGELTYSTVPRERMWGLAIRYIDDLDEAETVLSHMTVTPLGATPVRQEEVGMIKLNPYGGLAEKITDQWGRFAYDHSLEYLVEQKSGWMYTHLPPTHGYKRTQRRRVVRNNEILSRVKVNYNYSDQVANLSVNLLRGRYEKINMQFTYDQEGKILSRHWSDVTGKSYRTQRFYTADGRLLREDFERKWPDENMQPFLSVQYHYLSGEDLRARIGEEQIVKVEP